MKFKSLFSVIFLLLSVGFSYSKTEYFNDSKATIEKAYIIMSELKSLGDYMADSSNIQTLSGKQLQEFRGQALAAFEELNTLQNKVEKEIAIRKEQLKIYSSLVKQKHEFTNKVVQERYLFLKSKLSRLEEAKVYIADSKQLIDSGLSEISHLRIESRNRDILKRDNFLGSMGAWHSGFKEISQNADKDKLIPFFISAILAIIIYNICLYLLGINIEIIKRYLSAYKDRRLIIKISIFLRIFWSVLVASLLTIGILKLFFIQFGWSERNYIICIYFVIQNIVAILIRILGINIRKSATSWLQLYIVILLLMLSVQGIDFFSTTVLYNPVYGAQGNTIISFILSLFLLIAATKVVQKMRKSHSNKKGLNTFHNTVRFVIFMIAISYLILSFVGSDNLAAGIVISILRMSFVLVLFYSLYSAITIGIYILLARLNETNDYGSLIVKKIRDSKNETIFEYWLRTTVKIAFITVGIILLLMEVGIPYQQITDNIYKAFYYGFTISGEKHFAIVGILESFIILAICLAASKAIQNISDKHILPYVNIDDGTHKAIYAAIGYMGIFISVLIFVYSFGISGTSLAFIVSGLSVGFGFAMQDLIKNFFAGFMLLIERPVKIGDWINIQGEIGEVKKIRIRSTLVETFNHNTLIVPNSIFMSDIVSNETFNPLSRIVLNVKVAYESDPRIVSELLYSIAKSHDGILDDPIPYVVFEEYGDYSLNFTLRAFCYKIYQLEIESDLRAAVYEKLKESDIDIPIEISRVLYTQDS